VLVSDAVLRAIETEIAAHAPERGGALLGPRGHPLVTHLVADPGAESSGASWRPSRGLDASVKALERGEGLELKGLVHSHPPGVLEPTAQDRDELAEGLRLNGHMPSYLAPIVARATGAPIAPHEVALPSGRVAFFAAYRTRGGGAEVRPLRVRIVPLLRDLETAARALGGGDAEVLVSELEETPVLAGRLRLHGLDLLVLAGDGYPSLPPVVLATAAPGGAAPGTGPETEQLHVTWRIQTPEARRLAEALRGALVPPGPFQVAFGPSGGPALTRDADRARRAGWERRLTGEDAEAAAERLRDALFARTGGILSDALRDRSALVAGLGSVGSYVAEQLARSGVGRLALLDPEPVDAANLSRTVYETADVGLLKTDALARRLLRVQPTLRLDLHPRALGDLPPAALDALVRSADLVVAATDDPAAQRTLNRFAYARGRPAMFVGLHAGARGGEVILTVPGRTPCYLCATRTRGGAERAGGAVSAQVDYGTARLRGEVALGADIQHVSSAAVKLGLSLLVPRGGPAALAGFAEAALAAGTPFLTLSMVPDYWFYPDVFADTPGQGAYQAVWLTPHSSPECPVCGDPAARVEPLDGPARAPSAEALRKLRDA
jgi:proteasome lid subunit RPN8/RPN11